MPASQNKKRFVDKHPLNVDECQNIIKENILWMIRSFIDNYPSFVDLR